MGLMGRQKMQRYQFGLDLIKDVHLKWNVEIQGAMLSRGD
jgi:hypothetical protein